jgi:hypothetical protein
MAISSEIRRNLDLSAVGNEGLSCLQHRDEPSISGRKCRFFGLQFTVGRRLLVEGNALCFTKRSWLGTCSTPRGRRVKLLGIFEIGRTAPAASFSERFDSFRFQLERRVGLALRNKEQRPRQKPAENSSLPIHPRFLQFESKQVRSEGMGGNEMEMFGNEVEHLMVVKPQCRLSVDFKRGRIKHEHVTPVFQSSDVLIHR